MASKYERTCKSCGKIEETFSRVLYCAECYHSNKKLLAVEAELNQIDDWGYTVVGQPTYNTHGKREYKIINRDCDHQFKTTFGNLRKGMLRNDGFKPCAECGKIRRTQMLSERNKEGMPEKSKLAFIEITKVRVRLAKERRLTREFKDAENYRDLVRLISNKTYKEHYYKINPNEFKRGHGHGHYHLDHIVPIDYCFKNKIPAELCASKENLTMLPYDENIRKQNSITEEAIVLLEKWHENIIKRDNQL